MLWFSGSEVKYPLFEVYRVGDGNQREAVTDLSLDSLGAPEDHTLSLTYVNDVNVTCVDRPSMAKLLFLQHPCCKLLIINSVSGVITGSWSMLEVWCLTFYLMKTHAKFVFNNKK